MHRRRPLRASRPFTALFAVLVASLAGSLGCYPPADPDRGDPLVLDRHAPGTGYVDVSEGSASAADAEAFGSRGVYLSVRGASAGQIEVVTNGRIDASFVPTLSPSVDLGARPLVVESDLLVPVVASEPPGGTPYLVDPSTGVIGQYDPLLLHVADGDGTIGDEPAVTGIHVAPGATLTLTPNLSNELARFEMTGGLLVEGELTTVADDPEQRSGFWLDVGGDAVVTGRIDTRGVVPGQDAGWAHIWPAGRLVVSGELLASGADAVDGDGGDGAIVWFVGIDGVEGPAAFELTGRFVVNGGNASGSSGRGGDAGGVSMSARGPIRVSEPIEANGGAGVDGGGDGGAVDLRARQGSLRNTARLSADGGTTVDGSGGNGGQVTLVAGGGSLYSSGDLFARGADTTDPSIDENDVRSEGGTIQLHAGYAEPLGAPPTPPGDVWVSGVLDAQGGDAPYASRSGGKLSVTIDAEGLSDVPLSIHLVGYTHVDARGGHAALRGGYGGQISLLAPTEPGFAGSRVVVEPPVFSAGGDADPGLAGSLGGAGGDIVYQADALTLGPVEMYGGAGETPGEDGVIRWP